MPHDAQDTIKAIDAAIAKAIADGRSCLSIWLAPHLYQDLLRLKGMEWKPTDKSYSAKHNDRPLKTYRFWPLYLLPDNNPQSCVEWPMPGGAIRNLPIVIQADHEKGAA